MKQIFIVLILSCIILDIYPQVDSCKSNFYLRQEKSNEDIFFTNSDSGDTILYLSHKKYPVCYTDTMKSVVVVCIRNKKGCYAIDRNKNILFEVYNLSYKTQNPDQFSEGLIRIIKNKKVGFADENGKIIVAPHYDVASPFKGGIAMIGDKCKIRPWNKKVCDHLQIECKKWGYIDNKGRVIKFGNYSYLEIMLELGWLEE